MEESRSDWPRCRQWSVKRSSSSRERLAASRFQQGPPPLLLDVAHLTTPTPVLRYGGGKGATSGWAMPNRSTCRGPRGETRKPHEVEGKEFVGNYDEVVATGGRHRRYSPLWCAPTYLELTVSTQDDRWSVEICTASTPGTRFERRQQLDARRRGVADSRRGMAHGRLVRHRRLHGLPYYEHCSMRANTRIQALVSLYAAGDAAS